MHTLNPRLVDSNDVSTLLGMMEAFNLLEGISWNASSKETALRFLLNNRSLGVVVMLEIETRPVGYFVLTWGYDLEWDGRDAFLTELFLVPEVRGQGLGGQQRRSEALRETWLRQPSARVPQQGARGARRCGY